MSKTYVREIFQNSQDSHQTSPHWLVTFTRFNTRDTKNYGKLGPDDFEPVRRPLVVENDCISISVNTSKTNTTPSATMVFLGGDLNYATAVSPGDFVIINMVNSSQKARELRDRALASKPINKAGDGFKGVFKVNSVNEILAVDPGSGIKTLRYQVTAYGFTEFNNIIYYNPTLGNAISKNIYTYSINSDLLQVLSSKRPIQEVLKLLPTIILGETVRAPTSNIITSIYKPGMEIPKTVFQLLGIEKGNYAADLYTTLIGTWTSFFSGSKDSEKMNPQYKTDNNLQTCNTPLSGNIPVQNTSLTNVKLTDLLNKFLNDLINEMYFCYRLDKDTDSVIPKVIIRQKPFNTEHGNVAGTKFLSLPRWKISPDLIYNINVSKNESLRFNFVHIMPKSGRPLIDSANMAILNSTGANVKYDTEDIKRHGLRPYVKVSDFDWPTGNVTSSGEYWTNLVFDWVYGGHLKLNGTIQCVGIEEDICIGDNLELGNTVYHIESISHTGNISSEGIKSFRTNITLTSGVDKRSNKQFPVYPQMDYTDSYLYRKDDFDSGEKILPGFSDTQDIIGRTNGEELKETPNKSYTPKQKK
jgi:hypothetical protein